MADVNAIFGSLLIFGLTFPGMLTTCWLLFPQVVERARQRLEHSPWKCFWLGAALSAVAAAPIGILLTLPFGLAKFLGWALLVGILTGSSLGSAGIAAKMGDRIGRISTAGPAGAFVRGALALELAVFFPVLGWLLILPATILTGLGASGFALLRRAPRAEPAPVPAPEPAPAQI